MKTISVSLGENTRLNSFENYAEGLRVRNERTGLQEAIWKGGKIRVRGDILVP
jgi:hypothetical protein